jgi:hypothetical protein
VTPRPKIRLDSDLLNLAGEYRVCSELNKRGMFATVTYGHRKSADIYLISDRRRRALRVEVKTSQGNRFVTSITQKGLADDPNAPDFWVLVHIQRRAADEFCERFFVLTHREICRIQSARNRRYAQRHRRRHKTAPDFSRGVDNVVLADVVQHENAWSKVVAKLEVDGPTMG